MKHFRDLVLSTKEPAVKNVLWIDPVRDEQTGKYILGEYRVKMFEDGWKVLFGGGGEGSNGLGFQVDHYLPNGDIIIQLYDERDPNNKSKVYPITRAKDVYLINGDNVEDAINRINTALSNISLMIKKASFQTEDSLNVIHEKRNNTYWVYESRNQTIGQYIGESYIRKYTTNNEYTKINLSYGDIVINTNSINADVTYVQCMNINNNVKKAQIKEFVDKEYLNNKINEIINTVVTDVQVDGDSVVSDGVANISRSKRAVYIVTSEIFNSDYNTAESKAYKTFFIRNMQSAHGVDATMLYKYTDTGLQEDAQEIPLFTGDLLFNMDDHITGNDGIIPNTLYLYDTPQNNIKIHPLTTSDLVNGLISQATNGFNFNDKYAHLDYVNYNGNIYQGLKQGEEQMLVLKSMGSELDGLVRYDYNDDGIVDSKDIEILTQLILNEPSPVTIDGKTYEALGIVLEVNGEGTNKIIDLNKDGNITSTDITYLYSVILQSTTPDSANDGEFVGTHKIFVLFDPTINKLKIGYNYKSYIDPSTEDRENLILLTLDPSPNVIYCNSITNDLYRWNTSLNEMVKLTNISRVNKSTFIGTVSAGTDSQGNQAHFVEFQYGELASIDQLEQIYLFNITATVQELSNRKWIIPVLNADSGFVELNAIIENIYEYNTVTNGKAICLYNSSENMLQMLILSNNS